MICAKCLVLIIFLWWFWRSVSLKVHTCQLISSTCVWRNLAFQTAWKVSSVARVVKNAGKRSMAKNTTLLFCCWLNLFGLTSSFLSNRQLQVVLNMQSSQEYPVNAGVLQGSILVLTLFLLYINELPDDICSIAIYANEIILYSKCNQASDLSQQL